MRTSCHAFRLPSRGPSPRECAQKGAMTGAVEGEGAVEREGLKLAQDMPLKEQVIFTGSSDWTPDQAEHYIDWRIQSVDTDIARLRQQLDDLIAQRKRWLAVTGGRSKVFGIANGNGHGATTPA